nr:hypothetical protein GCM10025732_43870 [Glycomyces mayteni]
MRTEIGEAKWGWTTPPWLAGEPVTVPGSILTGVGLQLPGLWPVQAVLIHLTAA